MMRRTDRQVSEAKLGKGLRLMLVGLGLIALGGLAGCAAVEMASPMENDAAHHATPLPGKGLVYVYRSGVFGAAIKLRILMDGRDVGQTVANSFFLVDVAPGKHTIMGDAENTATLDIQVEEGKVMFVSQDIHMGLLSARNGLTLRDEKEARKKLEDCKLIKRVSL
ncbi:MAG: DUF2846 domain-containing protein [Deltaproteobacteria bacterium]|nr:DUF2846 domain-containing protein [Deltaproteobacteria bacterium]